MTPRDLNGLAPHVQAICLAERHDLESLALAIEHELFDEHGQPRPDGGAGAVRVMREHGFAPVPVAPAPPKWPRAIEDDDEPEDCR